MPDRRLRIAFVVDRFGSRFGGAEAYGVELMRDLAARHDITVFARDYDPACDLQLPYIPVRSWKRWPSWMRVLLFAIKVSRLTRQGYDIVHSHMNGWCGNIEVVHVTPVRYKWRARRLPWFKLLGSRLSPRVQAYLYLEARRMNPHVRRKVVAVSALIADQVKTAYEHLRDVPVIQPGVAPAQPDYIRRAQTRQTLGYDDEDFVCLLVARNPLRKGLSTALAALSSLAPRVKLLVVGGNAQARAYVARQYPDLHSSRVQILGQTSDVNPYYEAADICVHPTLNDSFGMAPLEAMSFGLPVVLSPAPWCGFAQYLTDGTDALLLKHPENVEHLSQCIDRLKNQPDLRQQLRAGAKQVASRHSWPKVAQKFESLYYSVLADTVPQALESQSPSVDAYTD